MIPKKDDFTFIAAPYTPMDKNGNVMLKSVAPYAEHLIGSGVSGVFVCGTTGEFPSLLLKERKEVLEEWVKSAGSRLRIIAHVGGNNLKESMELASHAERSGANGVAALSPYFFKPNVLLDLANYLAALAAASPGLPFYYYHMPSITGVHIQVNQLLDAVNGMIPNFAGVKYTHNDLMDMQLCLSHPLGDYQLFHGFDEILLCGLSLGVQAAVGSTYNYMANVYVKMFEAYRSSDLDAARRLQLYSVKVIQLLNKYGGAVRAGKAIMGMVGVECGSCRLPLSLFSKPELSKFQEDLDRLMFFSVVNKKLSPLTIDSM
jgi:N-acetylneuraminate lyase